MKIVAFAGSNSSKSINHQLVNYVSSLQDNIEVIKLTDFDIPMYGIDLEEKEGIPSTVIALYKRLKEADSLIVSVAEHNGNLTAFFKSQLDWLSRYEREFLKGKKVIVLGTSPGRGGASSAIQMAAKTFPVFGAEVVIQLSLASFHHNFKDGKPLDDYFIGELKEALTKL